MAGLATRLVLLLFLILCLVACQCEGRGGRGRSGWNSGGGGGRVSTVGVIMLLVIGILGGFAIIAFLYICYKGYCSDDSSAKSGSSENVAPANAADTTANSKTTNTTTPDQPHVAPIPTAGACDSGPKPSSCPSTHTVHEAPPPPCYHSVINVENSGPSSSQAHRELSKASCPACALERSNRPGHPAEASRRGDKYKPLMDKLRNFFVE